MKGHGAREHADGEARVVARCHRREMLVPNPASIESAPAAALLQNDREGPPTLEDLEREDILAAVTVFPASVPKPPEAIARAMAEDLAPLRAELQRAASLIEDRPLRQLLHWMAKADVLHPPPRRPKRKRGG